MKCEAYVDGACIGNPGPGGWGVYLLIPGHDSIEMSGGIEATTNNQMELMAAIACLEHLNSAKCQGLPISDLTIYTDSQYVKNGITSWIMGWKRNGWISSNREPVKNKEFWQRLDQARNGSIRIEWKWVKGHSGNPGNVRADTLANGAAKRIMRGEAPASQMGQSKTTSQSLIGLDAVEPTLKDRFETLLREYKDEGLSREAAAAAIGSVFGSV